MINDNYESFPIEISAHRFAEQPRLKIKALEKYWKQNDEIK
jgi:hypothetical protein